MNRRNRRLYGQAINWQGDRVAEARAREIECAPGSPRAVALGCECPGAADMAFDCPLHGLGETAGANRD